MEHTVLVKNTGSLPQEELLSTYPGTVPLCRSTLLFLNVSQVGATEAFTGYR